MLYTDGGSVRILTLTSGAKYNFGILRQFSGIKLATKIGDFASFYLECIG